MCQEVPPPPHTNDLSYINERINNVFNVILSDINSTQQYNQAKNKNSNSIIYNDPFQSKDRIFRDLITSSDPEKNYNIHDLIEEEFQLEISDHEFEKFQTLSDVAQYVSQRLEVRHQLDSLHTPEHTYKLSYWIGRGESFSSTEDTRHQYSWL